MPVNMPADGIKPFAQCAHHDEGHGIERLWTVEGDNASAAAPLEQDFRL